MGPSEVELHYVLDSGPKPQLLYYINLLEQVALKMIEQIYYWIRLIYLLLFMIGSLVFILQTKSIYTL